MLSSKKIGILTGVTASGKTALALAAAEWHGLEVINADSLLVYRGFDIGTAKPSPQELARVPHHLVSHVDPSERYDAARFMREVEAALAEITARGRRALIVGGTGFYLKALLHGLWDAPATNAAFRAEIAALPDSELFAQLRARDPVTAARVGPNDRYRLVRALEVLEKGGETVDAHRERESRTPDPRFELWITDRTPSEMEARAEARARLMLEAGLVTEVRTLLQRHGEACPALKAVGYAQVVDFLAGRKPEGRRMREGEAGLLDEIVLATRQLMKKQRTWFRGQHPYGRWFLLPTAEGELHRAIEDVLDA